VVWVHCLCGLVLGLRTLGLLLGGLREGCGGGDFVHDGEDGGVLWEDWFFEVEGGGIG